MATCENCHSEPARPTKKLGWACYDYARRTGRARPEDVVVKHNVRRHEKDTARRHG